MRVIEAWQEPQPRNRRRPGAALQTVVAIQLDDADLGRLRRGRAMDVPICTECHGLGRLTMRLVMAER